MSTNKILIGSFITEEHYYLLGTPDSNVDMDYCEGTNINEMYECL